MRKPFVIALLVLPVAVLGGYFGFRAYVAHVAESRVESLFTTLRSAGVEASHGAVSYDVFGGTFELRDISLAKPGQGRLTIASFLASGIEQPASGRVAVRRVDLSELAFEGPLPLAPAVQSIYRAPTVELHNLDLPETVMADGPPARVALAVLESLIAERLLVPNSTTITRTGEGAARIETTVTHGPVTFEGLAKGQIAKAGAAPSTFTVAGGSAGATGSIGEVEATTIDLATLLILLDPDRRQAEQDVRTLYGSLSVDGYEATTTNGALQSWKRFEVKDFGIRPASIPVEELIESAIRVRDLSAAGKPLPKEETAALLRSISGAYDGIRIGSIRFSDLNARQPDGGASTLTSIVAGPLAEGSLQQFAMEGLKGTDGKGEPISIDRLAISGLRPGAILDVAANHLDAASDAGAMGALMRLSGIVGAIELTGASGPSGTKGQPVVIDRFAFSVDGEPDTFPTRLSTSLRMSAPTSLIKVDQPIFALVPDGVSRASIAVDLAGAFNEAEGRVAFAPLYIEMSDAFSLAGRVELSNVDDAVFSAQPDEAMASALMTNLDLVELTLTDSGLYERKLAEAAREQGLDPEALRQLFAGFAELLLSAAVSERPELDPAVQALVRFLQQPMGTLALRITPREDPLPLMMITEAIDVGDPLSLVDELNFTVIAPQPPPGVPMTMPPAAGTPANPAPGTPMQLRPNPARP